MRVLHFIIDIFLNYGNVFFWGWTIVHAAGALWLLFRLKPYEVFIAMRYLKSRCKQVVISAVTFLSVVGVALGVAALIAVLGGMTGFEKSCRSTTAACGSQISKNLPVPSSKVHVRERTEVAVRWSAFYDRIAAVSVIRND